VKTTSPCGTGSSALWQRKSWSRVTLVATSILGRLQWEGVAHPIVLSWWLYMFWSRRGGSLWRSIIGAVRRQASTRRSGVPGSLLARLGGNWVGAAGILLYPEARLVNQLFLVFSHSRRNDSWRSFDPCTAGGVPRVHRPRRTRACSTSRAQGDETHLAMAFMAGLFTLATVITTRRINLTINSSLNLRFENATLWKICKQPRSVLRL
jgi:hypothetical protein